MIILSQKTMQGITFMLGGLLFVPLFGRWWSLVMIIQNIEILKLYLQLFPILKLITTSSFTRRGCLLLGSFFFTLAPILTHFTLNSGVPAVCFSYGVVSSHFQTKWDARPCSWERGRSTSSCFPLFSSRSPGSRTTRDWWVSPLQKNIYIQLIFGLPQVLGIVTSGFGLSSTVFSPLQTLLINPSNLPPLRVSAPSSSLTKSGALYVTVWHTVQYCEQQSSMTKQCSDWEHPQAPFNIC